MFQYMPRPNGGLAQLTAPAANNIEIKTVLFNMSGLCRQYFCQNRMMRFTSINNMFMVANSLLFSLPHIDVH